MSISRDTLRGYILEEVLAYLIRNTGYRLLVDETQDPIELGWRHNGLVVNGRGAVHQVDVLGELLWIPAFTYPLRLFVEAKFRKSKTGIDTVRNLVATLLDVNQNNMPQVVRMAGGNPPRPKYHYVGAIFSTSGFSDPATDMALAHSVSLIDISTPAFAKIREAVSHSADEIIRTLSPTENGISGEDEAPSMEGISSNRVVRALRNSLRSRLNTNTKDFPSELGMGDKNIPLLASAVEAAREFGELFVGMGRGPFMLVLSAENREQFLAFTRHNPAHDVHISWNRSTDNGETWTIYPLNNPTAYRLSFKLPKQIADWVFSSDNVRKAAKDIKQQFLSDITIFRHEDGRDSLIRLRFDASQLRG